MSRVFQGTPPDNLNLASNSPESVGVGGSAEFSLQVPHSLFECEFVAQPPICEPHERFAFHRGSSALLDGSASASEARSEAPIGQNALQLKQYPWMGWFPLRSLINVRTWNF